MNSAAQVLRLIVAHGATMRCPIQADHQCRPHRHHQASVGCHVADTATEGKLLLNEVDSIILARAVHDPLQARNERLAAGSFPLVRGTVSRRDVTRSSVLRTTRVAGQFPS